MKDDFPQNYPEELKDISWYIDGKCGPSKYFTKYLSEGVSSRDNRFMKFVVQDCIYDIVKYDRAPRWVEKMAKEIIEGYSCQFIHDKFVCTEKWELNDKGKTRRKFNSYEFKYIYSSNKHRPDLDYEDFLDEVLSKCENFYNGFLKNKK